MKYITDCESASGNILCQISDHFPHFIIVKKCTINQKSCSFAKRDHSNFNEDNFVDDYSSLDLSMLHDGNASVDKVLEEVITLIPCTPMKIIIVYLSG